MKNYSIKKQFFFKPNSKNCKINLINKKIKL